jgi:DNA-binding XRE family transcriptional regulator
MAKHGISREDISKTIDVSYRNTLAKINGDVLFDIVEAGKIVAKFKDVGEENVTIDSIFFS